VGHLLRQGRTIHFLIEADGHVVQLLDPVHAALGVEPQPHQDVAIYIGLVAPRRPAEWLPDVLSRGALPGVSGVSSTITAGAVSTSATRGVVPAPKDAFATRRRCAVAGQQVVSEVYPDTQTRALGVLLRALAGEYPQLTLDTPRQNPVNPLMFQGVLLAHQLDSTYLEPACLDLPGVLTQRP